MIRIMMTGSVMINTTTVSISSESPFPCIFIQCVCSDTLDNVIVTAWRDSFNIIV